MPARQFVQQKERTDRVDSERREWVIERLCGRRQSGQMKDAVRVAATHNFADRFLARQLQRHPLNLRALSRRKRSELRR